MLEKWKTFLATERVSTICLNLALVFLYYRQFLPLAFIQYQPQEIKSFKDSNKYEFITNALFQFVTNMILICMEKLFLEANI